MFDQNALTQGLVGGLMLARAEKAPSAGMRAGILMAAAGGFTPVGAVLAQTQIRNQLRRDKEKSWEDDTSWDDDRSFPTSPSEGGRLTLEDLRAIVGEAVGGAVETLQAEFGQQIGALRDELRSQSERLGDLETQVKNLPGKARAS